VKIENYKLQIANCIQRRAREHERDSLNQSHQSGKSATCHTANSHFSFFNFQFSILFLLLSAFCLLPSSVSGQAIPDKMVATVTNGSRATPDLITYSDLVWQLTLEPGRPVPDHPSSADLNHALRLLQDQLLILQEARKLPLAQTVEAQKEFDDQVKQRRDELAHSFGSRARLEERMSRVGLTSEQLDAILRDRVTIERYLDFRFRSFAIVSAKEISDQYEKQYRSQRNSGRIVPTLDEVRDRIEHELMEARIAEEIDKFVDSLREQPGTEIVVLNPV